MNVELRLTADPESRAVYVDGKLRCHLLWYGDKWRLTVSTCLPVTSIPWAVIEAVTEFRSAHQRSKEDPAEPVHAVVCLLRHRESDAFLPTCVRLARSRDSAREEMLRQSQVVTVSGNHKKQVSIHNLYAAVDWDDRTAYRFYIEKASWVKE